MSLFAGARARPDFGLFAYANGVLHFGWVRSGGTIACGPDGVQATWEKPAPMPVHAALFYESFNTVQALVETAQSEVAPEQQWDWIIRNFTRWATDIRKPEKGNGVCARAKTGGIMRGIGRSLGGGMLKPEGGLLQALTGLAADAVDSAIDEKRIHYMGLLPVPDPPAPAGGGAAPAARPLPPAADGNFGEVAAWLRDTVKLGGCPGDLAARLEAEGMDGVSVPGWVDDGGGHPRATQGPGHPAQPWERG